MIRSTTELAFDETSGLLLSRPERAFVPSYIEALRDGLPPARHPTAADEITHLQSGDSETWDMFAKTCANSTGTDSFCMEDMFWLTKEDVLIGYIVLRTDMAPTRQRYGGNTGRAFRASERNKGYGTAAIGLTQAIAAQRGFDYLEMVTSADNVAAIRPWEKRGARLVETIEQPPQTYYTGAAVKYRLPTTELA